MFKHQKIKFLFPALILILILLVVSSSFVNKEYVKLQLFCKLKDAVELTTYLSKVLHETQKERGVSSAYLANNGLKFKNKLMAQRRKTDKTIQ